MLNCGCTAASRILVMISARTVPWNFGEIFCGLYEMLSLGISAILMFRFRDFNNDSLIKYLTYCHCQVRDFRLTYE